MNVEFARAKKCVDHYRRLGLCPLPSRMDIKGPWLTTFAEHYQGVPVPEHVYDDKTWRTTNIQILTGTTSPTPTKVIVVDLDGPEAIDAWGKITAAHGYVPNKGWVGLTGGGGQHRYFLLSPGMPECPSGIIWGLYDTWGEDGKGKWARHKEIRILADNNLVIAPPSIHVDPPYKRYEFAPPDPNSYRLPEPAPDWLLGMTRLMAPRFTEPKKVDPPKPYVRTSDRWYTREEVIEALADQKLNIATNEWGLVTKQEIPNLNGWVSCFVPGREDPRYSRPSGSFHYLDGTFQDRKDLTSISFFDLGVMLGKFATWQECRDALGDRFIGKRPREAT